MKKRKTVEPTKHKFPPFDFVATSEIDAGIVLGTVTDTDRIREFIHRRRRQMIVHSVIYYRLNDNIVDDHTWQEWANQLAAVQKMHPTLKCIGFHDELFDDWDGSTGNHLDLVEYYSHAQSVLGYHREKYGMLTF